MFFQLYNFYVVFLFSRLLFNYLNIQKNRAYQILFDRKYEEQLEKTLSEMRAESYVNIKIKS